MTHREESIERLNKTDKESPQKDGKENEDKLKETDLSYLQKSDLEVPKKLLIIEPTEPSQANSLEDKPAVSPNDKGDSKDVKIGFVVTNVSKHGKADSKDVTESKEEDNKYKENEEGAVVTENSQTSGQTEEKTPIEIPQKIPAIPDMAPEKVKMEENPMGKQTDKESSAITDTQQEENLTEIIHKPEDSQVTNENHTEVQKKPEDLTESKEETLKINESFTKTSENSPETPVKLQNLTETQTDKPPLPPKNKNYIFGSSSYRNGLGGKGIGSGSSKIGSSLPSDVNSCATGAKESTDGWRLRERSGTESDACSTSLLSSNKGLSKDASTSSPTLKITHAPDRPPSPLTTNSRALNSSDSSLGKESSTSNTSLTVTQAERGTAQAAMGGSLPASPSAPKRHKRAPPVPVARSLHSLNSSQSKAAASSAPTTNPVPKPRKSISLNPFDSEDDEEEEGRKEEIIKEEQERNEERKPEEQLGMATKEAQATDSKTTVDTKPTPMPVPVPRKTVPYNPFDSDDDDEETSEPARRNSQTTITTNSTEPAGKSGQTKASISSTPAKPPTISKNPFESDEDEDMEETEFTPNRTSSPAKFGSTSITSTSNQNNASTTSSRLNDSVSSMNSTRTHNTTTSTNPFDEDGDYEEDSMNESFQRDSKIRQSYNVGAQSQLVRDGPRASLPPTYRSRTGKKKRPAPPPPGQNAQDRVRNESQESLSRGSSMSSLTKGGSGSTTSLTTPPSTTTNTPPKRPPPPRPPPPKVKN